MYMGRVWPFLVQPYVATRLFGDQNSADLAITQRKDQSGTFFFWKSISRFTDLLFPPYGGSNLGSSLVKKVLKKLIRFSRAKEIWRQKPRQKPDWPPETEPLFRLSACPSSTHKTFLSFWILTSQIIDFVYFDQLYRWQRTILTLIRTVCPANPWSTLPSAPWRTCVLLHYLRT